MADLGSVDPNVISAIKSSGQTKIISNTTGKVKFFIDFANKTTINLKGSQVSAKANGEDYIDFNNPSTLDMDMSLGVANLDLYAFAMSSEVGQKTAKFMQREVFNKKDFTEASDKKTVEIHNKPLGDKVQVYILLPDLTTQVGELTATVSDKTVSIEGVTDAVNNICVYYYEETACRGADILSTPDDKDTYTVDTIAKAKGASVGGNLSLYHIVLPKVTVTNDLTFDLDATKPGDIDIKIKASKTPDGRLGSIYNIPLVEI